MLLFALALSMFPLEDCGADSGEAALAIKQAEDIMVSCYQVVLKAESARGNVSGLLARLNEAEALLTQAHALYRLEDFDHAACFAELCSQIGGEVRVEAHELTRLAVKQATERLMWAMIRSILSITIIVSASFVSWRIFKLRYCQQISEMKPEVDSGES